MARPENSYILSTSGGTNVGFYKDGASTIPGFKAYLASGSGSVKLFRFDDETGINSIDNGKWTIDNADIYNLSGQKMVNGKLSNGKLPRGLYIVNGKKVIIK